MTEFGFPDSLQFARIGRAINDLKRASEDARVEVVTGRATSPQQALGGDVDEALLLDKAINDADSRQLAVQRALSRTSIIQLSIDRTREDVSALGSSVLGALGRFDETNLRVEGDNARTALEVAVSSLNQRYEGRALFAGDAVDGVALAPAADILADVEAIYDGAATAADVEAGLDAYFDAPGGGFETAIYTGGAGDAPRVEAADGLLVDYSIRADDQVFRDTLRALAVTAVAAEDAQSEKRTDVLEAASSQLIGAGNDLSVTAGRIGVAQERLDEAALQLEASKGALTEGLADLIARDPFEAASRLQELETQLQASFILSSRISTLTLANFLR